MANVELNGNKLHEIRMRLKNNDSATISHLSYPEHRISTLVKRDTIILQIPVLLALELYHRSIISSSEISVKINGRNMGSFTTADVKYPDDGNSLVDIAFLK